MESNERSSVDDDLLDQESGLIGGFLRSLLRNLSKQVTKTKIKIKIRPREVARSADSASTLLDVYSHFKKGHQDNQHYSVHTRKRFVYAKAFFFAAPIYIRSMLLDTALFWCYERSVNGHDILCPLFSHSREMTPIAAFSTGLLCGAAHGYMTTYWDTKYYSALDFFKHHNRIGLNRPGAALSGGLMYAALFGGYEATKYSLLYFLNIPESHDAMSRIEGFSCILTSGLVASYLSESVSHYMSSFEEIGIAKGFARMRTVPVRSFRSLLPAVATSTIGFIAYEYTKDKFDIS